MFDFPSFLISYLGLTGDIVTYNTALKMYANCGDHARVEATLKRMNNQGLISYTKKIHTLCKLNSNTYITHTKNTFA